MKAKPRPRRRRRRRGTRPSPGCRGAPRAASATAASSSRAARTLGRGRAPARSRSASGAGAGCCTRAPRGALTAPVPSPTICTSMWRARGQQPLDVDVAVAERRERLRAAARVRRLELVRAGHGSHAAPAAAGDGLEHDPRRRRPGRRGRRARLVEARRARPCPASTGTPHALGERPARALSPNSSSARATGRRSQPRVGAAAGERRVLAQKPVARMDRVASGLPRRGAPAARRRGRPPAPAAQSARLVRLRVCSDAASSSEWTATVRSRARPRPARCGRRSRPGSRPTASSRPSEPRFSAPGADRGCRDPSRPAPR